MERHLVEAGHAGFVGGAGAVEDPTVLGAIQERLDVLTDRHRPHVRNAGPDRAAALVGLRGRRLRMAPHLGCQLRPGGERWGQRAWGEREAA